MCKIHDTVCCFCITCRHQYKQDQYSAITPNECYNCIQNECHWESTDIDAQAEADNQRQAEEEAGMAEEQARAEEEANVQAEADAAVAEAEAQYYE